MLAYIIEHTLQIIGIVGGTLVVFGIMALIITTISNYFEEKKEDYTYRNKK